MVVNAWKGRYGERGALRRFLLETLTLHAPRALDTLMLFELAVGRFGLRLETGAERKRYCDNTLRPALRKLQQEGLVEAMTTRRTGRSIGEWRKTPETTLRGLTTSAEIPQGRHDTAALPRREQSAYTSKEKRRRPASA
jgi:hypothetical protein